MIELTDKDGDEIPGRSWRLIYAFRGELYQLYPAFKTRQDAERDAKKYSNVVGIVPTTV